MKTSVKIIMGLFLVVCAACAPSNSALVNSDEIVYPKNMSIMKRADWGSIPAEKSSKTHTIEFITIHHGGVEFLEDKNAMQHVKNLQSWSRKEKNWVDIPYHYMISPDGIIFEARPLQIPGDTNTEYDPTNHALVEVMGNFEVQELNSKQLAALLKITKFLALKFDIPYERIKTHKDYSEMTVCPGKNIYSFFSNGSFIKMLQEE